MDKLEAVARAVGRRYPDMLARGSVLWKRRHGEAAEIVRDAASSYAGDEWDEPGHDPVRIEELAGLLRRVGAADVDLLVQVARVLGEVVELRARVARLEDGGGRGGPPGG